MKVNKLILKNFAAIKNAMDANKIEIDFTDTENKICLLIGPNGKGKTSILSMISPFAELGNLDVRNSQSLILEGKDGYKEIIIVYDGNEYTINHYYTHHDGKSHSVKSYILKNGIELNPNGNVTSFKEYVKEELKIETDYLKLIRLGNNVTSLISLSETERKTFMSKILDDIGIYLDYYKVINNKLRQIKDMMSHTQNKISKLGIYDKTIVEVHIDKLSKEIDSYTDTINNIRGNIAVLTSEIDDIKDKEELSYNYQKLSSKINKMRNILENKKDIKDIDATSYKEKITSMEKEIEVKMVEINTYSILLKNTISEIDSLSTDLSEKRKRLSIEDNIDSEIKALEENTNTIRKSLRKSESILGDIEINVSKNELDIFISYLKNSYAAMDKTIGFSEEAIKKVCELIESGEDINNYIYSHMIDIDEKKNNYDSVFLNKIASSINFDDTIALECSSVCEARKLFLMIKNILKDNEVKDKNRDISFYKDMEYSYKNISIILSEYDKYTYIIKNLPDDLKKYYSKKEILSRISKGKPIYDDIRLNEYEMLVTEKENYLENINKLAKEEDTLSKMKSMSNIDNLRKEISDLEDRIDSKKDEYEKYFKDKKTSEELVTDLNNTLEVSRDILETITEYDKVNEEFTKVSFDLNKYNTNKNKINEYEKELKENERILNNLIGEKTDLSNALRDYNMLNKEYNKFNKVYDNMVLIKDALSSKTGIPLKYIRKYFGDIVEITNDLLDIAYNGNIFLDEFDISPTSFLIPFYNKGVRIPDVKYASQGELSFLSIALSFALSSQKLSDYNIMLLDEIDGPLDPKNRELFIKILEKQMDKIDSEQSFLITHNSMFSSYPVDIIDLSFENNKESYPLANFIEIKRS